MLDEIVKFFTTGEVPVNPNETIEMFTFMEASNVSKRNNGEIIYLEDVYRNGLNEAKLLLDDLKK